jgi:hypothetical protein
MHETGYGARGRQEVVLPWCHEPESEFDPEALSAWRGLRLRRRACSRWRIGLRSRRSRMSRWRRRASTGSRSGISCTVVSSWYWPTPRTSATCPASDVNDATWISDLLAASRDELTAALTGRIRDHHRRIFATAMATSAQMMAPVHISLPRVTYVPKSASSVAAQSTKIARDRRFTVSRQSQVIFC